MPVTRTKVNDDLVIEAALQININNEPYTVVMRTPGDDHDLIRGLMYAEDIFKLDKHLELEKGACAVDIIKTCATVFLPFALMACAIPASSETHADVFRTGETSDFTFRSNSLELSGVFDTPEDRPAEALILFVHGYGGTDIRANQSFGDLRRRFGEIGIASAVWDKPGQGRSEGSFDINQSVYESAQEVVDAAKTLRAMNAPGSDKIGIWGISRAGWIAPLAMEQHPDLEFWISVSGVVGEDNFPYLLLSNLPHEGGSVEDAEKLSAEWQAGCALQRTGGSYDAYLDATEAQLRTIIAAERLRREQQPMLQTHIRALQNEFEDLQ